MRKLCKGMSGLCAIPASAFAAASAGADHSFRDLSMGAAAETDAGFREDWP